MKDRVRSLQPNASFFLQSIRKRRYRKSGAWRFKRFPAQMLCYVVEGEGAVLIGDETCHFEAHQLYLLPSGKRIEVSLRSECLAFYMLVFEHYAVESSPGDRNSLRLTSRPQRLFAPGLLPTHKTKQIYEHIQQLHQDSRQPSDSLKIHIQFQQLLGLMMPESPEQEEKRGGSQQGIEQTLAYMQANFHDKIDMKLLSDMAGLTTSSYSRLFKKLMAVTPVEYLAGLRIENAKRLLLQPQSRIREVSSAVGYPDEFYFSRIFRRLVGVTPTIYMKRNRMKVAVASCLRFQDSLLSFGVQAVAAVNCCQHPGMDEAEYARILSSGWTELVHAKPDLIIGDRYHERFYEKLQEVAPAVVLAADRDWLVNYRKLAELLGREREAEHILNQLTLRVTGARRLLQSSMEGRSISVIQVTPMGIRVQGTIDHPLNNLLFQELGLKPGQHVPLHAKMLELPPEWLPPLEADYVFIIKSHSRDGSERIYDRLRQTEAWSAIPAVQCNRVKLVPQWLRMSWTPIGRRGIVEELLSMTSASR